MRTRRLPIALVAVLLCAGCDGSEGASNNNNNNGPPRPPGIDHMIESVTLDASENVITIAGVFRPSDGYAEECAPHNLGTSEIVHVIALYPDAEDYRPFVWQYSDATPISAEEFETRAEAAAMWLNGVEVPIQRIGIERIRTQSVRDLRLEGSEHMYSGTRCTDLVIDYANGTHAGIHLFCGACVERGVCGDGWCDEGEAGCGHDCPAPLVPVCGDGWCEPDEAAVCPEDCPPSP